MLEKYIREYYEEYHKYTKNIVYLLEESYSAPLTSSSVNEVTLHAPLATIGGNQLNAVLSGWI